MFQLTDVMKRYRRREEEVVAFRTSDLKIASGEYVAIVGPSGSGKTTLLSLLGGMLSPDSGKVEFQGESIYDLPIQVRTKLRRSQIGFVFQTFNLIPYLTARENVQVPLYLAGMKPDAQRERAEALLEQVGLSQRLNHKPSEMSTGQQQRVALARTLANSPKLILADEPTGNLDPDSKAAVMSIFTRFVADGGTIVMVTHDPASAAQASRRLRIVDGLIQEEPALRKRVA
ncbi:Lipoprotein-releasing system ATP-binding protein LolD [Anatilimnocola aggregata]|uniref:Lipoprotein-releasing system ATP-binding protein LolD n=1 Tax=Anatilimnocola aggregata TaxID=2528021 RepID=A0A517YAS4_9BACT|nr:ABC transporter ATP-binding protein [Anatilimnocola aggregata]QDU27324.1 Lipoprotein-releasing system ATP-binding protein LolD [Anatilimnocola aggregata]